MEEKLACHAKKMDELDIKAAYAKQNSNLREM